MPLASKQSWGHYYADSGSLEYYARHVEIHQTFLDAIIKHNPRKILEAGCGSGIMSIYFAKLGIETSALDRNSEVLQIARETAKRLGTAVRYVEGDIFRLEFANDSFDAVFSQGVLEHFSDKDIQKSVREQLRVAKRVWISVPSQYYNHRDFGDERLLSERRWQTILSDVGEVQPAYYFYQRVKRNWLLKRPLMLMLEVKR